MYKILVNIEFNKLVTVHKCLGGCNLIYNNYLYDLFEGSIPECLDWVLNKVIEITEEELLSFGKDEQLS